MRAPSPNVQLGGQTSFGQLFDWPSAPAPPASEPAGQQGQQAPVPAPPAPPPGSQWDPPVQRPASLSLGAFSNASAAPASLPPGPFSRGASTPGGEDAPPSMFGAPGGGVGGLLGGGLPSRGAGGGLAAGAPSAGSATSLDALGTAMRARSPWAPAEEARGPAGARGAPGLALGSNGGLGGEGLGGGPGSGLGSTPRSGMGGGFMEAGGMGAFTGGLGMGLSGQLSRQLSSTDGLGAWDLGGAGAGQARCRAGQASLACLRVLVLCSSTPWDRADAVQLQRQCSEVRLVPLCMPLGTH